MYLICKALERYSEAVIAKKSWETKLHKEHGRAGDGRGLLSKHKSEHKQRQQVGKWRPRVWTTATLKENGNKRLKGSSMAPQHTNQYVPTYENISYLGSVQFSRSVVSDSLWPHGPQHARPPCPSPTPRVHSNPCPLSQWCHPAISSSVIPFSSRPQSLPASESFPMSQLFTWGGQSIAVSALASVLPVNIQDWFALGWTGWISLQSRGLSRVFSNTTVQKHQFSGSQLSSQSNSHIHTWPLEKP